MLFLCDLHGNVDAALNSAARCRIPTSIYVLDSKLSIFDRLCIEYDTLLQLNWTHFTTFATVLKDLVT